jgi:hypothetical protein
MTNLKKKMASALAVLTLFTYASATCMTASASNFIGDVNNDNKINNNDTLLLQSYVTKHGVSINSNNADVNGDGDINIADVVSLMQTVKKGFIADATPITGIGRLQKGKWYSSPNDKYFVTFQGSDGNLVIYRKDSSTKRTPCWSSGTNGCDADFCQLQDDGNFVIYDKYSRPVWTVDSYKSPAGLFINNNGELFVYSYKDYCKVWSSVNSHGKRIYQPPIKPVHKCSKYQCYCKDNKWFYGCPECDSRDHEVSFLEYAERTVPNQNRTYEAALTRYLELLGCDSSKVKAAVNAYSSMYGLKETQRSSIRENMAILDDVDTAFLPDCKGKDIIEKYQNNKDKVDAIVSVYDLFNNSNKKTVDINTFNKTIDTLKTFVGLFPLGDETYGNLLEGMKKPAKEAIMAGLKHNCYTYLNGLPTTWTESSDKPGSYDFWESGVTAKDLENEKEFDFDNGRFTVEEYLKEEISKKADAEMVYDAIKNLKCIQAATGDSFWELVEELY